MKYFLLLCCVMKMTFLSASTQIPISTQTPIWELDENLRWKQGLLLQGNILHIEELVDLLKADYMCESNKSLFRFLEYHIKITKSILGMKIKSDDPLVGVWECLGLTNSEIRLAYEDYDDSVGLPNCDKPEPGHIGPAGPAPSDSNPAGPGVHYG